MKFIRPLIIVLLLFVICVYAQVPPTVSYQGYLAEDTGQPVTDGTYSLAFTIYDDSLAGTALWSETQIIDVIDGVFHAQLGAVDSLDLPFNNAYYLALAINGGQPLTPRVKLTSSAYSLTSRSVWGEDNIFPSSDYVGIGTTTPSHELTVHGDLRVTNQHRLLFGVDVSGEYIYNADGQTLRIHVGDEDRMHFANNGDVGIGTVTPSEKLQVDGMIYSSSGGFRFPDGTVQTTADTGSASGGSNTLDQAYDQGGPGAGRSITADAGAFEVGGTDGVVFGGTYNNGIIPTEGEGTRMMWYPGKAAFRAGRVIGLNGDNWDADSIGLNSFASGLNTRATGGASTAMGSATNANGNYSSAFGFSSSATGGASTAFGWYTEASGFASFSAGQTTIASGDFSTAIGYDSEARGNYSTAIGHGIIALGSHSVGIALSDQSDITVGDNTLAIMGGKVGIETTAPQADLEILGWDGVLFRGSLNNGSIPTEGTGLRMMWYPAKAAFRAGNVSGDGSVYWNADSIGVFSFASGYNTRAVGEGSTAFGVETNANGENSVAMGEHTEAIGDGATSMGYNTMAIGNYSTAIGSYVSATGIGSLVIGDQSTSTITNHTQENTFYARFARGYRFFTNSTVDIGARLLGGANAWSTISDSVKKENFKTINGEEVLNKIGQFKLSSWNYKGQDKTQFRHYGPMAQDFYNAFGHDGIGKIGNDTTIASADFDGINFIAIQALGKRTVENEERGAKSEKRIMSNEKRIMKNEKYVDDSKEQMVAHEELIANSQKQIAVLQDENKELKNELTEMKTLLKDLETMIKNKAVILSATPAKGAEQ